MKDVGAKKELIRLVAAGMSIGAASDKVGISRSTGQRWIQRLKVGKDSQQAYEERQRVRALGGAARRATAADVETLWAWIWDRMPLKVAAHAEGLRLTPEVVAEIEKRAKAEGIDLEAEEREHYATLKKLGLEPVVPA